MRTCTCVEAHASKVGRRGQKERGTEGEGMDQGRTKLGRGAGEERGKDASDALRVCRVAEVGGHARAQRGVERRANARLQFRPVRL